LTLAQARQINLCMTIHRSSDDPTNLTRRRFLRGTAAVSALALAKPSIGCSEMKEETLPAAFASLKPLRARVTPLTAEDFLGRLQRAQELMSETSARSDALFVGPGSSLSYYTGIRWVLSERLLGLVQEDEIPTKIAAGALADRGIRSGRMAVEEAVPFTFYERMKAAAPGFEFVPADT
jgi:Xaa-Pro dipeptidase